MPPKRIAKKRVAAIEVSEQASRKRGRVTEVGQSEAVTEENELGDQLAAVSPENGRTKINNNNEASHVRGFENINTRFNFSCAALENSVYNYNGTSTGCPRDWLKIYERYATMKGWSESNMAMAMPLYLRGPAMAWFDRLPRNVKQDYTLLREAFIKGFELSRTEVLAELDALVSRKQLVNEDLDTYMLDIGYRCRRLKRTPEQEFEYTLQGLLPTIKRQVLLQQASTLDDIRRIGKLCQLVPTENSMHADPEPAKANLMELVASLQEKVSQQEETIKEMASKQSPSHKQYDGKPYKSNGKSRSRCTKCGFYQCRGKDEKNKTKCFAFGKTCNRCTRENHFQSVCRTKLSANQEPISENRPKSQSSE